MSSEDSDSTIDEYYKSTIKASPRNIQHVAVKLHHPKKNYFRINGEKKLNPYPEMESHGLKCEGYKVIDLDLDEFDYYMNNMGWQTAVSYLSELIIK